MKDAKWSDGQMASHNVAEVAAVVACADAAAGCASWWSFVELRQRTWRLCA